MGFKLPGLQSITNAALSGIPFLGEGFAAQQQQEFSAGQASAKQSFDAQQAQKQMEFQREMSSTAHQREVEDLRKAGLNPVLSAGGSGASTPGGSMAVGTAASGAYGSGAGSSAQMVKSLFTLERNKAKSEIAKTDADTEVSKIAREVQREQKKVLKATAKSVSADAELKELSKAGARVRSKFEEEYGSDAMMLNTILDMVQKGASSAGSLSPFKGLFNKKLPKGFHKMNPRTGEVLD